MRIGAEQISDLHKTESQCCMNRLLYTTGGEQSGWAQGREGAREKVPTNLLIWQLKTTSFGDSGVKWGGLAVSWSSQYLFC